ncbi:MAG: serine hydrolase domain-containing protein [Minicystis sp.]
MGRFGNTFILTASFLIGCAAPAHEDDSTTPEPAAGEGQTAEAGQALSAPRDAIDCGFNHNRTCKSSGPLPNGAHYRALWDPCYGGEFTWSATVNFEQGYDFLCVNGTASAFGCSNGGKLTGNTTYTGHADGLIPLEILTDYSVQSAGIVSLTATCDEPLFLGVWAPSATASSQQLHRSLNWTQLNTKISDMVAQGLRLSKIELYYPDTTSGYAYFDALFDAGSGGWGFNAGITWAQLQSLSTTNAAQGLVISDVEAQQTANGVVYIAVFKAGTATQKLFDGYAGDFQAWAAPYLNDDYKVTTLESYQSYNPFNAAGNHRLTAVLTRAGGSKNTTGEWSIVLDADYPSLAKLWKDKLASGQTLARVETRLAGGVRYYDAVFQKSANAADFAPSTRWQQFSAQMTENQQQGWALVDIDRLKSGYTSSAPMGEELPITNEYPAAPPEWAARVHNFMRPPGDPIAGGYTIALSRDGELLGVTSSGDIGDGTRMTPEAHWDYYSNAKTLTGLAALKLAEQKGYNIHTQTLMPLIVNRLDPAKIGSPGAGYDLWDITIWDALTHNTRLITPGCNDPGSEKDIITAANIGPVTGYSGANPCMLRLMIEEQSGETFEGFFRKYITIPVGIHDMDCTKDPEHDEVLRYTIKRGQPGAPGVTDHVVNHQCSAGGFIGTAMALLQVINGTRNPGMLGASSLAEFRAASMTFYPYDTPIWFADMGGGDGLSMGIHLVQFPEDPVTNTWPNVLSTAGWQHGVQAVLLSNFYGLGTDPVVGLMKDAPQ